MLGWFAFLTGRISIHWSHAQHIHHLQQKITKPALRWTSSIIQHLFDISWDMWCDRNNIKHESTTAAAQREMAALDKEMNEHRAIGVDGISTHDRCFLTLTREHQQSMSIMDKRLWLHTAEAICVAHANRQPSLINSGTQQITNWFAPVAQLNPDNEPHPPPQNQTIA